MKIFAKETCTIESIITRDAIETPRINYRQFPIFKKLILTRFSQSRKKLFSISLGKLSQRDAVETPHYRINRQQPGITGLDFSRAFGIPSLDTWRSAIGADTGIKGGKAGHLAPISLNRIFNPVPLSAVCRVVYCLTCTRPDCTIRGTLMHDKLAIYLPVHGFTCTRAPRNHLPATMELSYLDRSRG